MVSFSYYVTADELDRTAVSQAGEGQFFYSHYRQEVPTGIMLIDFVKFERQALRFVGIQGFAAWFAFTKVPGSPQDGETEQG